MTSGFSALDQPIMTGVTSRVADLERDSCDTAHQTSVLGPEWRVAWKEPEDLKASPELPENTQWKLFPVN